METTIQIIVFIYLIINFDWLLYYLKNRKFKKFEKLIIQNFYPIIQSLSNFCFFPYDIRKMRNTLLVICHFYILSVMIKCKKNVFIKMYFYSWKQVCIFMR